MMSKGFLSQQVVADANAKLECAIEELRVKYEKKAEEERKAAAAAEATKRAKEAEGKPKEADWMLEDPDLEKLRQERLAALRSKSTQVKQHREAGHGELREIVEEEFLKEVTSTKLVVVHFFHDEFEKCRVMDMHLRKIAAKALQTKFLRLNAQKSPFFIAKLKVKVLPSLIYFVDGIAFGRQTGFEGLAAAGAATDDFPTSALSRALKAGGALGPAAKDRADSDSEDEGGGGAGSHMTLDAARRLAARSGAGDAEEDGE